MRTTQRKLQTLRGPTAAPDVSMGPICAALLVPLILAVHRFRTNANSGLTSVYGSRPVTRAGSTGRCNTI